MRFLVFTAILVLAAFSASGQGAGSVAVLGSVAELTNRPPSTLNPVVTVSGYRTNGDWGPARTIRYEPGNTNSIDSGCDFVTKNASGRWHAMDCAGNYISVAFYGAIPNDGLDDTAAITAASVKVQTLGGGTLLVPPGTYNVTKVGPVAHFANISNVSISADGAVFTEADYVDSTWTAVALTSAGTVATAVWASPHGFIPGSLFLVKDSSDAAFDGYWTVTHVDSPTQIRFNLTAYNVPSGAATALAHVSDTSHVLFRFDACTNVNLGKIVFRGHVLPVDNQFRLGWRVVEVFRGTKGVRGELDVNGAAYGFYSGEYGNQSISGCSDLRIKVVAKNVGYPVQATGLDDSAFEVVCDTVHRGGYFGGVRRSSANIWAKNWDIVGALLSHQPDPADSRGCEDFTLRVWDTGTTVPQKLLAYGGYRHMASVAGYSNANAVKHRNLDIRVYGKDVPRAAGLIVQTYGTNHWIDGLKFGGNMDQSGLNHTNTGWPFFIYDTSPTTAGHYKDLVIEDFTWTSTTNSGAYPGYIRLAQAENDVEFNRYSTDIYTSQQLPDGIHTVTVPRFPDWTSDSYESAQIQGIGGGISFMDTTTAIPMASGVSSNDFTVQWVGDVPSDNSGLFVLTSGASATTGSFGASVTNGHLIVRAYGASSGDWIGLTATNWASTRRGKVASLGIVKTASGLSIYTDGHTTYGINTSSGTPPAWSDAIIGTNVLVGVDNPGSGYLGKVYRLAVWNFSRALDFPELAVRWEAGAMPAGGSGYTISDSIGNGSFETLGGGGADVFASWTEQADGGSTITASTNAINGSVSMALSVDGLASFVGVTSSEVLVPGVVYEVSFWGRVVDGASGQIALVGAAGGDYPIVLSGSWARYSYSLAWNAVSFSIKRWSLTGLTAEIDDVRVRRVGVLCDYDWTKSPADMVSGAYSSPTGGVATKVLTRGLGISADRGDASVTLRAGHDAPNQVFLSAVTGAKTITLSTDNAVRGDSFWIMRTGGGAGTLTIAAPLSRAIANDQWIRVLFNGSAWTVAGYGQISGAYAGTGTGNADTNLPSAWSGLQTFNGGIDASAGTNDLGVIHVTAIESDSPIGQSIGGTGGTNAASAREALGLTIGYDVQAQDPILQDLADLSLSDGDMLLVSGTDLTALATTSAGRTLLTAANAAAQWDALKSDALQSGAYDSGTWNGVTDKAVTPDQFRDVIVALPGGSNAITSVTAPLALSNGVLSIDTSGLGGGGSGGFVYILTNSLGSYISSATATNWPIIDTTISSNDLPTAVGKFIEGAFGAVTTNNSGTTSTNYFTVKVNGSTVFRDFAASSASAVNGVKAYAGNFWLIYESTNTASLICFGGSPTAVAAEYGTGDFGINMTAVAFAATNIPVSWSTNLALSIAIENPTTVSTPAANGMRRIFAWMRRDGTNTTAGTGDVVGPASATSGNIATFNGTTGKLIQDGGTSIASLATEAEVAAGYQPLDADLTDLADGSLTGSKVGTGISADNISAGTLSSNRLPSAVAFTTIDAGTLNATAVVGDASGLTGINATNITAGTLPDARLAATIARTNAPTLHSPALLGDPTAPTAAANDNDTSIATTAYVQAEETALKALNLWQATNAALTALAGNPSLYQATNGNLTTLAGASITGDGNFMRTRTGVPRTLIWPANALNGEATEPATAFTNLFATATDRIAEECWRFSATATNGVGRGGWTWPLTWDAGTVNVRIWMKQLVAETTSTNVFSVALGSAASGDTGGALLGTPVIVKITGANDTNKITASAWSSAITVGNTPAAGDRGFLSIRRHPGNADDQSTVEAVLMGVDLEYTESATEPTDN